MPHASNLGGLGNKVSAGAWSFALEKYQAQHTEREQHGEDAEDETLLLGHREGHGQRPRGWRLAKICCTRGSAASRSQLTLLETRTKTCSPSRRKP